MDTGTNPPERLGTFARNVHEWQADHPNEPASKESDGGSGSALLFAILSVCLGAVSIGVFLIRRSYDTSDEVKFKASPGEVRDVLRKIQDMTPRIDDSRMRESVVQAVSDTEAYFRRSVDSASRKHDANVFVTHLTSVKDVLTRYIDVQEYPRFYDHPSELKDKGLEAINGFSEFVLQSIKEGRRSELTQFNVDTDILSAQRFR